MRFASAVSASLLTAFTSLAQAQEAASPYQFFDGEFDAGTQATCFDASKMGEPSVYLSAAHATALCLDDTVVDTASVRALMEAATADLLLNGGALTDMRSQDTGAQPDVGTPASIVYYGESTPLPLGCARTRFAVLAGASNSSDAPQALGVIVTCPTPTAYRQLTAGPRR